MSDAVARVLELFRQTSRRGVTGVTHVTRRQVTAKCSMVTPVTPVTYENPSPSIVYVTQNAEGVSDACDVGERAAIAIHDGGIPEVYTEAFARLQIAQPIGIPHHKWLRAIDDAGRFLDQWGKEAERLQWSADDLFTTPASPIATPKPSNLCTVGLCWLLEGAGVEALDAVTVTLSDGRSFCRLHAKFGSRMPSEGT
jgi:hypothetical protein